MQSSGYWAWKYVLWLLLTVVVLLLFVVPLVTSVIYSYAPNSSVFSPEYFRAIEKIQSVTMVVLTGAWFFYVGSCLASFLNVVAWRVPRGRSILGSSHCTRCHTKLSFRENIPIFGWLNNRGRCAHCHAPIDRRYVDVELTLGAIFLLVVLVTLASGGINLPLRVPDRAGFSHVLYDPQWDLIQILVYQLLLISVLFTMVLVELDGKPIPNSLLATGILVGILFPAIFPAVQIVPWQNPSFQVAAYDRLELNQLIYLVLGGGVGGLCGALIHSFRKANVRINLRCGAAEENPMQATELVGFVLCGLFLGWQSALSVALIVVAVELFRVVIPQRLSGDSYAVTARFMMAVIVHLVAWRLLSQLQGYWPSHRSEPWQIFLVVLVLCGWTMIGAGRGRPVADNKTE